MKISVLIPIYNVEPYLDKCLASLRAQTMKDIEFICINDGSTDGCTQVIDKYTDCDQRFRVINKKNTGYGNSMNIGLDEAKGDYIAIVESDDFVRPDMMQFLYDKAVEYGTDIVKTDFWDYYNQEDENETFSEKKVFGNLPRKTVFAPMEHPEIFLIEHSIWTALYRRDFLKTNNIRFNETPGAAYQDVSFSFLAYINAKSIILFDEAFYCYRRTNPNSSVKNVNKMKILKEAYRVEEYALQHMENVGIMGIAGRLCYKILMENYYASGIQYQYALLLEIQKLFKKHFGDSFFEGKLWSEEEKLTAKTIIENVDLFFYKTQRDFNDDRIYQYNKNVQIILDRMLREDHIIIYGAGKIGQRLKNYLLKNGYSKEKAVFAVTSLDDNPHEIDGIKVRTIEQCRNYKSDTMVVLALQQKFQYDLLAKLNNLGYKNVVSVDLSMNVYLKANE